MTKNIQDAVNKALETVSQFDDMETAIENFYDESPIGISKETAKALLIFSATIAKRHSDKNPVLLFEALRKSQHDFKGALKPLNDMTVRDFLSVALRDFEVLELNESIETDEKEEVAKFVKGDIVQLKDTKEYAIVESVSGEVVTELWMDKETKWEKNVNLRKVTDKKEKQIARILIEWDMGSIVYCYNEHHDEEARLMIINGDNKGEFKLLDIERYEVIPHSNTNSPYNVAYFIVNNFKPASIEVL